MKTSGIVLLVLNIIVNFSSLRPCSYSYKLKESNILVYKFVETDLLSKNYEGMLKYKTLHKPKSYNILVKELCNFFKDRNLPIKGNIINL